MEFASCLKVLRDSREFGRELLALGNFSQVLILLGLLFMFFLGFKFSQFIFHGKGFLRFLCDARGKSDMRNGFCEQNGFGDVCNQGSVTCKSDSLNFLKKLKSRMVDTTIINQDLINPKIDFKRKEIAEEPDDDHQGFCDEDQQVNVSELRKLVKIERRRAKTAFAELEKERIAAATAANEAMAMILRLQSEKSAIDMEASQYRRMAEQKLEHDQELIQLLQCISTKQESQISLLEGRLRSCRQKLKIYANDHGFQEHGLDASLSLFISDMEDEM